MEYGKIAGVEKPVSRIIQGTIMVNPDTEEETFPLLDKIFEMGCNTFDTARGYGGGLNEKSFGKWVRDRGIRDEVVVIAKGCHHDGAKQRVTPADLDYDIKMSLDQLGFDYIDIYLLHRDDPKVEVGPIIDTFNRFHSDGLVKACGGSNWSHVRIRKANEYAESKSMVPFVASSPHYSLAEQFKEPWTNCITIGGKTWWEAREWYAKTQMPVLAWSSLAGGFFSGRFSRDDREAGGDYFDKLVSGCYCWEENFQRLDRANELAGEKGVTVSQIALAFVLCSGLDVFPLVGCRTAEQFADNAHAIEVKLSPPEVAWLNLESDER